MYSRSIHWTFLKIGNVSTKKLYMCNLSTRFPFSIKTVLNVVCCLCKNISERLTLLLYTLNAYKQISFHEKNGSVCLSLNKRRKSKQKTSTQTQKLNYKKIFCCNSILSLYFVYLVDEKYPCGVISTNQLLF